MSERGERGVTGAVGAEGRAGTTGIPGAPGSTGAPGAPGTPGTPGATGATGPRARHGAVGFLILITFCFFGFVRVDQQTQAIEEQAQANARFAKVVRENQCDVLNRLAETKLFIRSFLEETSPDTPSDVRRFAAADEALTQGIEVLIADIKRTKGCKLFASLKQRRR